MQVYEDTIHRPINLCKTLESRLLMQGHQSVSVLLTLIHELNEEVTGEPGKFVVGISQRDVNHDCCRARI